MSGSPEWPRFYIVRRKHVGGWGIVDDESNLLVDHWYADEEDAQRIADRMNEEEWTTDPAEIKALQLRGDRKLTDRGLARTQWSRLW